MRSNQLTSSKQNPTSNRWAQQAAAATRGAPNVPSQTKVVAPQIAATVATTPQVARGSRPSQRQSSSQSSGCGCNTPPVLQCGSNNRGNNHGHCPSPCSTVCSECDRQADSRSLVKGQDALVSAARMTLSDVSDQYSPSVGNLDDPIIDIGKGIISGSDVLGPAGRQLTWYAPDPTGVFGEATTNPSFVAYNQLASIGNSLLPAVDVNIPLWSYYEVIEGSATTTVSGTQLVLKQSGPLPESSVIPPIISGFPAGQDISSIVPFSKHKLIAVTRAVPNLVDLTKQYFAVEIYASDSGLMTDRFVLSDVGAGLTPIGSKPLIVIPATQGVGPISNDDKWLFYNFEVGTVHLTGSPVVSYDYKITGNISGFLRINPVNGKFLIPSTGLETTTTDLVRSGLIDLNYQISFDDKKGSVSFGPLFVNYLAGTENPTSKDGGIYQLVLTEQDTTVPPNPLAPSGAETLSTGLFDSQSGAITIFSNDQVLADPGIDPNPRLFISEAATGFDISDDGHYLIIGTREIAPPKDKVIIHNMSEEIAVPEPLSVSKQTSIRDNIPTIPQRQSELRYYEVMQEDFFNSFHNSNATTFKAPSLHFRSAVEISARINFAALSRKIDEESCSCPCQCDCESSQRCFKLAIGTRAYSASRIVNNCLNGDITTAPFSSPPIEVLMFTFDTITGKFFLQDAKPVAASSFTGGFSVDDEYFATYGRPSLSQFGVSLWSISEQS